MTTDPQQQVLWHGVPEPPPQTIPLRAGPLALDFVAGDLRAIRLGQRELIQRIYVAVRDHNWATIPLQLENVTVERQAATFHIAYDARHQQHAVDFRWRATISGAADGTLSFALDGAAHSAFARNRIGICVLHPAAVAGAACRVEHTDGTQSAGAFPRTIAPHQPFLDVRALAHQVDPEVWAELRFAGDVWETEDQRNWTDASFKTYSTPLALPFPVTLAAGTSISQRVTLQLQGDVPSAPAAPAADAPVTVTLHPEQPRSPLPGVGLGVASHGQPLTAEQAARLRALNLGHLRVDLRLTDAGWKRRLAQATAEAAAIGAALEVALRLDTAAQLDALTAALAHSAPPVARWLVFQSGRATPEPGLLATNAAQLRRLAPTAPVGSGTDANFAELNRNPPPLERLDLVSFAITPQVHADDDRSVIENLAGQAAALESAHRLVAGRPVVVSPVTLKPRFNAVATAAVAPDPLALPSEVDPRQMALFGAAWTLGSFAALAYGGAASVTYYETTGWRGVMERPNGPPLPECFRSLPNGTFPLYHVLRDIGELRARLLVAASSSDPLRCAAAALEHGGRRWVLLANLTPAALPVQLQTGGATARIRVLDETSAVAASHDPDRWRTLPGTPAALAQGVLHQTLAPYAVARIEIGSEP